MLFRPCEEELFQNLGAFKQHLALILAHGYHQLRQELPDCRLSLVLSILPFQKREVLLRDLDAVQEEAPCCFLPLKHIWLVRLALLLER